MIRFLPAILATLALTACEAPFGRRAGTEADVKFVGVGVHPDEVGPPPEPYGGVVEYDHVDFAGAGLPLGLMGLSGSDAVGPNLLSFEPPYSAVFGFSYIFDTKLSAASTLAQVGAAPPAAEGTCYTSYSPSGPIGSFTTADVGDYMEFSTGGTIGIDEEAEGIRFSRTPADYPANAADTFVYYIGVEAYTPQPRTHLVPSSDAPDDPAAMVPSVYRQANYPFGENLTFRFPGGHTRPDQNVSSIPLPNSAAGDAEIPMPDALGPVRISWSGPRYNANAEVVSDSGIQDRCFEFVDTRADGELTLDDCRELADPPGDAQTFDSFPGQVFTGPWDTDDGVTFEWDPNGQGDQIALSVRFMAPVDLDASDYQVLTVGEGATERSPQACEEDEAEPKPLYASEAQLPSGLRGDPQSQMAIVSCLLENNGSFTLTRDHLADALDFVEAEPDGAGGVVFFFSRGTQTPVPVPAAKDAFGQRQVIDSILVTTRSVRIGRFHWEE